MKLYLHADDLQLLRWAKYAAVGAAIGFVGSGKGKECMSLLY